MAASSPFYALNGYEWDIVMVFRVCGADEMVNLEGTTDGCWREAVVLCLNDQVHGEQSHSE